jgi:hypothetical protein
MEMVKRRMRDFPIGKVEMSGDAKTDQEGHSEWRPVSLLAGLNKGQR